MSVIRSFSIMCDDCKDREEFFVGTASDARKHLRVDGWRRRKTMDYCPACASTLEVSGRRIAGLQPESKRQRP